jgi:hypothetical protein
MNIIGIKPLITDRDLRNTGFWTPDHTPAAAFTRPRPKADIQSGLARMRF